MTEAMTGRAARQDEAGFTLVEALVALAILAVASVALLGAGEAHVARIDGLEARAVAGFAAQNRLAEIALAPADAGALPSRVTVLGRDLAVTQSLGATADPQLAAVSVVAREAARPGAGAGGPAVRLDGFADLGGGS